MYKKYFGVVFLLIFSIHGAFFLLSKHPNKATFKVANRVANGAIAIKAITGKVVMNISDELCWAANQTVEVFGKRCVLQTTDGFNYTLRMDEKVLVVTEIAQESGGRILATIKNGTEEVLVVIRGGFNWAWMNGLTDFDDVLKAALKADIKANTTLKTLFEETTDANKIELAKVWKSLHNAERTGLKLKPEALIAFAKVSKNTKLRQLGFTDDLLANVRASRLDEGDFATILDDLDNFGNKMTQNSSIEFDNFDKIIGKFTNKNTQYTQSAQWIIQDITDNASDFTGKKWKFEHSLTNSDGNTSSIDMIALGGSKKFIEYKWLTTSAITESDFILQFVKRDLFNTDLSDLEQLEWRIKGNKLTKEKVVEFLSSSEGRKALDKKDEIRLLFQEFGSKKIPNLSIEDIDDLIHYLSNNEEWFNLIFK